MIIIVNNIPHVLADPAHCDQSGWPSCYSVGYGDGQANPGTSCPNGHSNNFCAGWNAASYGSTTTASVFAHTHTAEYWNGYKTGQEDGKTGIFDPGGGGGPSELQFQHWVQGYKDGYKSICGTLNSRMNPPCNSPPT